MHNRRSELDIMRIVGCILVMLIHASSAAYHASPIYNPSFRALSLMSTASRGSVGVFFMISGALFLSRESINIPRLLKKNAGRLVLIFFLWSFIYALGARLTGGEDTVYGFFLSVMRGHYHMWFLWATVLCYLFVPVLHCAIHGEKLDIRYLLGLFFLLGLLMANFNLTPEPTYILHQLTENLSVKYIPYLGYMVWGYFLGERAWHRRWLWLGPVMFILVTLAATAANIWYTDYKQVADGWLFDYFSLPSFLQATAVFLTFMPLRGKKLRGERLIRSLSECTLGVYLVHPLVISAMNRLGFWISTYRPVEDALLFMPALTVICFTGVWIARRIPVIRKMV